LHRPPPHTAALLIIGNEILSGKIRDENGPYLLRELRALGVDTRRVETVPDEIDLIVDALNRCRASGRHVFTSGGVGPTHDDVTIEAVAKALERKVIRDPVLEGMLREWYGDRLNPATLRLAEVPEGARLVWGDSFSLRFPAIEIDDILVLPGVPSLFVQKIESMKERFRAPPILLANLFLSVGEGAIAALLTEATARFSGTAIGSYPRFDDADHRVKVTVESRDAALVAACATYLLDELTARLGAAAVVRAELPVP
jgi:molybdenum cofactor synthesis domain-containing protein